MHKYNLHLCIKFWHKILIRIIWKICVSPARNNQQFKTYKFNGFLCLHWEWLGVGELGVGELGVGELGVGELGDGEGSPSEITTPNERFCKKLHFSPQVHDYFHKILFPFLFFFIFYIFFVGDTYISLTNQYFVLKFETYIQNIFIHRFVI